MVDKDLFLHDLSVVAILKDEGPYLKEWLDYHLLAGVDHFYLYDNDSTDNQAEVAKPYVEAGLVDYFSFPGKCRQGAAYRNAIEKFKFQSRYMAFIDCDEFIYPKINQAGIVEVVDEILSQDPNAAGVTIHWQIFGSNGQEKADYSRGVLERFTCRAKKHRTSHFANAHYKTTANPRAIDTMYNPHKPIYFEGRYAINEKGDIVTTPFNWTVVVEKIVVHHYFTKSLEEYLKKKGRGFADKPGNYGDEKFGYYDLNEEFDDSILAYRDARAKIYQPPDTSHTNERLLTALERNLSPVLKADTPPEFYAGKMEMFLTCRAVAAYLKTKLADDKQAKFFEETALKAVLKSLEQRYTFAEAGLLVKELPKLLKLPYPAVEELRKL